MPNNCSVFKPWPELRTTQMIPISKIRYSDPYFNVKQWSTDLNPSCFFAGTVEQWSTWRQSFTGTSLLIISGSLTVSEVTNYKSNYLFFTILCFFYHVFFQDFLALLDLGKLVAILVRFGWLDLDIKEHSNTMNGYSVTKQVWYIQNLNVLKPPLRELFIHGKAMVPYVQLSTNCKIGC